MSTYEVTLELRLPHTQTSVPGVHTIATGAPDHAHTKKATFITFWLPTQHQYESPSSFARTSVIQLSCHTAVAGKDALLESNKQRVRCPSAEITLWLEMWVPRLVRSTFGQTSKTVNCLTVGQIVP